MMKVYLNNGYRKKLLQRSFSVVFILLFICLKLGCASVPKVHSLYDGSADFSRYNTYGYVEKLGVDGRNYTTLLAKYLIGATDWEMRKRGYVQSEDPDLLINFYVSSEEKYDIYRAPFRPTYYHFRYSYGPWPYYSYETRIRKYTEGTLHIDLVDAGEKQLVWEGIAVGRVNKDPLKNLEANIYQTVALIFNEFPFVAGQHPVNILH